MDNANDNEVHVNVRVRDSRATWGKTPPLTFSIMMHPFSRSQNHLDFSLTEARKLMSASANRRFPDINLTLSLRLKAASTCQFCFDT